MKAVGVLDKALNEKFVMSMKWINNYEEDLHRFF